MGKMVRGKEAGRRKEEERGLTRWLYLVSIK
jgi:hypothetical protein